MRVIIFKMTFSSQASGTLIWFKKKKMNQFIFRLDCWHVYSRRKMAHYLNAKEITNNDIDTFVYKCMCCYLYMYELHVHVHMNVYTA